MDRLIELELVRCLGEVEAIGDIPQNTLRLERLSYKRSFLVFEHLTKWYQMRSSTDIQRQALYLKATFFFATRVLCYNCDSKDIVKYWDFVLDTLTSKNFENYWCSCEVELIGFVKQLFLIDQEAVFNFYFSVKMHFKPSRNRLWLLLGQAFVKETDNTFNERFLSRYCSRIENVHGSELKIAYCKVLSFFGHKISSTLGKSSSSSNFAHLIESIVLPKVIKLSAKVKYNEYSFPTWTALLGLCSKTYFLQHRSHLLNSLQATIYLSNSALKSILQFLWIYLNRHTEAWATMGQVVEELFKFLLSCDLKRVDFSIIVEIITVTFLKMPRIILNSVILPRLRETSDDWELKHTLILAVRNCLSIYCQVSNYNIYPYEMGSFLCELKELNLYFDVLGPMDSREFFDNFHKALGVILVSIVQSSWNSSILDAREESQHLPSPIQCLIVKESLLFAPLSNERNVSELCDAFIKLSLCEKLHEAIDKWFESLHRYPLLWLETLTRGLGMFLNMSEALIEKRKRIFHVIVTLLDQLEFLDESINLPMQMMQRVSALVIVSGAEAESITNRFPIDLKEIFDSSFEQDLYKRLLSLYYHVISKRDVNNTCYEILENYFLFIVKNASDEPVKMKKQKRSSWSFESLSKLSLDTRHNPTELYTLFTPCLEHENGNMRQVTFSILGKIPLKHVPLVINSLEDMLEKCSDELRNAKYKPVRNNSKSDQFKVLITKWIIVMLQRFSKETAQLEEAFVHLTQKHLLEIFYFESEIDLELELPELRIEFYRLIKSLFLLDRLFPRKGAIFPYKLQIELFTHLKAWQSCKAVVLSSAEQKEHESELLDTMFTICDGLLSPPPSLRGECISVNSVFSWIDDISQRKNLHEEVEKAIAMLLQNGAIVDHVIDRCYKDGEASLIFTKVLEKYLNDSKSINDKELETRINLALICNK